MLDIIRNRRSVRAYIDKEIPAGVLDEILKAAMFAPTAKNNRPWEFVVITDVETKQALSGATPYAGFAKNAPVVIALCYDTAKGSRFHEDCAICAENIYLEATNQGIGACYIQIAEGTAADVGDPEPFVKQLLGIPGTIRVLCLMPLGYPARMSEPHKDQEFDRARIHYERY
jgi:nitroreductase